jgi:hypothetical protein
MTTTTKATWTNITVDDAAEGMDLGAAIDAAYGIHSITEPTGNGDLRLVLEGYWTESSVLLLAAFAAGGGGGGGGGGGRGGGRPPRPGDTEGRRDGPPDHDRHHAQILIPARRRHPGPARLADGPLAMRPDGGGAAGGAAGGGTRGQQGAMTGPEHHDQPHAPASPAGAFFCRRCGL